MKDHKDLRKLKSIDSKKKFPFYQANFHRNILKFTFTGLVTVNIVFNGQKVMSHGLKGELVQ